MATDQADSTATGTSKYKQTLARLAKMNLRGLDDKTIAIAVNSLAISIAQFAALEANISIEQCLEIDRACINKIRKG